MTLHRATGCLPALAHCVAALFEGYAGLDKRWGVRLSSTIRIIGHFRFPEERSVHVEILPDDKVA